MHAGEDLGSQRCSPPPNKHMHPPPTHTPPHTLTHFHTHIYLVSGAAASGGVHAGEDLEDDDWGNHYSGVSFKEIKKMLSEAMRGEGGHNVIDVEL